MNAANLPPEIEIPSQSEQPTQRFILAGLEQFTFVFPSTIVAGISIIERSQILALPFYNRAVLGVIHQQGQIMPLISLRQIVGVTAMLSSESLTVIHLGDAAGDLAGIGLVVDRTLGMRSHSQLPPDLFSTESLAGKTNFEQKMRLFRPEIFDNSLWQPHRWHS
ncbi:MAG TPA: chemotaxis protein CheW [Cyanobacteria bacterium UBA11049]|nr:chemotaxis protein CheW [Cyanobacteria bacterium UBA11049]